VPELAGVATGHQRAAVDDAARRDAGAERDEQHVVATACRSEPGLRDSAGTDVVAEADRQPARGFEEGRQRQVAEAEVDRRPGDPLDLVHDAGNDDAGAFGCGQPVPRGWRRRVR